ncbi:hypothetical protein [Nocardia nova]
MWLSQRTTKQSTKAQLTASAELERDKHRRDACISTTREALSALTQLQDALVAASDAATLEGETRGALAAASNECALAASMALLLDMQESYLKLLTVSTVARTYLSKPPYSLSNPERHDYALKHSLAVGALQVDFQRIMGIEAREYGKVPALKV